MASLEDDMHYASNNHLLAATINPDSATPTRQTIMEQQHEIESVPHDHNTLTGSSYDLKPPAQPVASIPSTPTADESISSSVDAKKRSASMIAARRKRRGFFRTLGYERLNAPITIICTIGALALTLGICIRQALQPCLSYCSANTCDEISHGLRTTDIALLAVCGTIDLLLLLLSATIILAPGALMDYPRVNKVLCMINIVLLVWTLVLLIGPVAMGRHYIVPYQRVRPDMQVHISASGDGSAVYNLTNFYSDYLTRANHHKLLVRVYRAVSADYIQYAPASHYFSYSDDETLMTLVSPLVNNMTRTIGGLELGQLYAFMTAPVRDGYAKEISPNIFSFFPSVEYATGADSSARANLSNAFIDFRMGFKLCRWSTNGCT